MENKFQVAGVCRWTARILSILFAAFISIFAMDVFSEGYGFWKTALALLMHLIPTFLIILILILSWKREWIGGVVYSILAIAYIVTAWGKFDWSAYVMISGPLFALGILFLVSWRTHKQQQV